MKNLFAFLIFIIAVTSYSCTETFSSEIDDQGKVFARYCLHYKKNTSGAYSSDARVIFRESGTINRVQLDDGASITLNGESLEYEESTVTNLFDIFASFNEQLYVGEFGYLNQARFKYEDTDGNVYTNYAPLDSIGIASGTNLTAQLGDSLEIFWEGPPVGENQEVRINAGLLAGTFKQNELNANSIWMTMPDIGYFVDTTGVSADTTFLFPDGVQFSIIRETRDIKDLDAPNDKGDMNIKYQSGPYTIDIVE